MQSYERSWRASGAAHGFIDSDDDLRAQQSWCHIKMAVPKRFRWVSYTDHQLTRGFIRTHHLSNFETNGKVDHAKLPLGVGTYINDNFIFWKNVARTELLLMQVACHHLNNNLSSTFKNRSLKKAALNQSKMTHYQNFKKAQLFCKNQVGLLKHSARHPVWLLYQNSLPAPQIPNSIVAIYLSKRIGRFDKISRHDFRFIMPHLESNSTEAEVEAAIESMENYLRLVMCEYVLKECSRGNFAPAIKYQLCFPIASRSLYLPKQYPQNN